MVHQSNLNKKSHNMMSAEQRRLLDLHLKKQSQDLSQHLFNKVGSCFNQLQMQFTNTPRMVVEMGGKVEEEIMKTPGKFVENLFNLSQRLLKKELQEELDKIASQTYGTDPEYLYKTINENLTFVVTSLMRELLQSSSGIYLFTLKAFNFFLCFEVKFQILNISRT